MRRLATLIALAFLTLVPPGSGGPVDGTSWAEQKVPGGTQGAHGEITEPGVMELKKTFMAGERACVVVIGDHDPVVDIEVKVYDSKKNLVAQDRGQAPAPDYVAVFWYPPRQETYRIVIHSYGKDYNKCSVAIK